ncbi:HAD family hydrolase [Methylobacterium sp. Leaf399]|uniref:HAD family hydrolase n=1 Tax=unclassified Methylobacterium TaxID=2615210 RepID=UPI0006FE0765|nr:MULTISPECIES: HAD family hydrolase [unclassified Methylobacterium]KQT18664.1 HAD family hydrolase [Methylobacterium sp. Leaf399]KQT88858.1 HAD family hydrolase [Methylobacterium sp. Leaf466]
MPETVIFDVDGTLIDSNDQHARAWQDAFADFGHDIPLADLRAQIGKGGDQLLPVFLSDSEIAERGEALQAHRGGILHGRYLATIRPFPQVRALMQRLIVDGTRIALASSAKGDELAGYKRLADIADLVDEETSSDDAERSKPHPDIFVAALDRLGDLSPEKALVVGDTPYDAEAAGKAGLRVVGLTCGGWAEADLIAAGCIAVYRDAADLLARYDDSPLARA